MSTSRVPASDRKALLVSRAGLDRMQITLEVLALRDRIVPTVPAGERGRPARVGIVASALVGIGLPLLGRSRLSRMLRIGSLAMTGLRVARNWRGARR